MDIQISNFLKILKMVFDEKKDISLEEPVDWERMSRIAREQNLLPLFFEAACTNEQYAKTSFFVKDQMDTFSMVAEQIQRSNALLEVYEKISALSANGTEVTIADVIAMVAKAIQNSNKFFRKMTMGRKRYDENDFIVLFAKDFR